MTIYQGRIYRDSEAFAHFENCVEAAPNPADTKWVCDQDHWLAWDIPPAMGDQCPVVLHQADADGRCVGRLSRPECICREGRALL